MNEKKYRQKQCIRSSLEFLVIMQILAQNKFQKNYTTPRTSDPIKKAALRRLFW
ncbi:MAG: hypothetical protein PHW04_12225 [Candidatus Wallbacteria bacterium]|nr:hypothetical protein [Candidatus Wallbacteria bacterium]